MDKPRHAYLGLGQLDDALFSYEKALELDPVNAPAWSNRGNALGILGRYADAVASCDKALAIDPENANAWIGEGCGA